MAITAIKPQKEDEQARKPLARADTQLSLIHISEPTRPY